MIISIIIIIMVNMIIIIIIVIIIRGKRLTFNSSRRDLYRRPDRKESIRSIPFVQSWVDFWASENICRQCLPLIDQFGSSMARLICNRVYLNHTILSPDLGSTRIGSSIRTPLLDEIVSSLSSADFASRLVGSCSTLNSIKILMDQLYYHVLIMVILPCAYYHVLIMSQLIFSQSYPFLRVIKSLVLLFV